MDITSIIVWIIVGGIAGTLADWLVSGINLGCIGSVIVGILGAFIGGWLFSVLGIHIGTGIVNSIITAFVGALVLLVILRLFRRR